MPSGTLSLPRWNIKGSHIAQSGATWSGSDGSFRARNLLRRISSRATAWLRRRKASIRYSILPAPYTEFYRHPIMVRHALDAAQAAGAKRFVHVAPVYSYGPPRTRPVPESQPHVPNTRKGRFRLEQEQAVLERNASGLATMVVHLPDFYGPHAELSYANAFICEALTGKTASFIGPLAALREFVYVLDVAEPLLRLATFDDAYGRCWNLGGRSIEARDFINRVFAALGAPPKYRAIPKFMLQAVGIVQPFMREVAEMYYLFATDFVLDDSALQLRLGGYAKTPIEEGLAQTVAWMRSYPA